MNLYRTPDMPRPAHMDYPIALLTRNLSATEMLVYMLLHYRSNLSALRPEWVDGEGRVFVCYPVRTLAAHARRGVTAVKDALCGLERADLISRRRQGRGKPACIYIKYPSAGWDALQPGGHGRSGAPSEGQEAAPPEGKEAAPPEGEEAVPVEDKGSDPAAGWEAAPAEGRRSGFRQAGNPAPK